jgi:hypothetical protein
MEKMRTTNETDRTTCYKTRYEIIIKKNFLAFAAFTRVGRGGAKVK